MADIAVLQVTTSGLRVDNALVAAASGGDTFSNDGRVMLFVRNGGGSAITVTVDAVASVQGEPVSDRAVSIPAGQDFLLGPFPTQVFNNDQGKVSVAYSSVTSVTVRPIRL